MTVIATAGHVDHGKSTLVRALTGMAPDRLAEERRRGLTIDLGFTWTELPGGPVAFVDVPGHERFVSTMLAGVGPVPAVLFVVAADEGWMPQTGEHLDALDALGVAHGLLVVTRSDLADPEPALRQARDRLAGTSLAGAEPVCVAATTGLGLDTLRAAITRLVAQLPAPDPTADVRLWVDRAFTVAGAGTVLTGTLGDGRLGPDDRLRLGPDGPLVGIRELRAMGHPVSEARGVSRVAVNLRGVPPGSVGRGTALLTPGRWLAVTTLDVRLRRSRSDPDGPLPTRATLHLGSAAVPARVRPLGTGDAGEVARVTLSSPLPLRIGDRALLREPGRRRIVAGLTVLDVRPPPLARRGAAARRAADLADYRPEPEPSAELARRGLVRRGELTAMGVDTEQLTGRSVRAGGDWLLDHRYAAELAERLGGALDAHDRTHPLRPGMSPAEAARVLDLPDPGLLDAIVTGHPRLAVRDGRVHRADASDPLPPALRPARDALRARSRAGPFDAPDADQLRALGLGRAELSALVRAGELVRIAEGVYLAAGADRAAVEVLAGLPDPEFSVSTARQALGTSRRVAVPLLELLARRGLTVRTPDGRHRLTRAARGR